MESRAQFVSVQANHLKVLFFRGLPEPGGPFPLTSEISDIQTHEKPHERKRVAAPLMGVFIRWILQNRRPDRHHHLPAHPAEILSFFSSFLWRILVQTLYLSWEPFLCEMPLCPFWTSCSMLSKPCQSRWWHWVISAPLTLQRRVDRKWKGSEQNSSVCIAANHCGRLKSVSPNHSINPPGLEPPVTCQCTLWFKGHAQSLQPAPLTPDSQTTWYAPSP